MDQRHRLFTLAALTATGCPDRFDPLAGSASATNVGHEAGATDSMSGTVTGPTGSATSTTASGGGTTPGDDGSSSTTPTGETTSVTGSSSTGESTPDYALAFDGTSYARRVKVEKGFQWPSSDFTVEVWAEIRDTSATGIIFDTANVEFQDGWVFYLHNEAHTLVFSFFDENNLNQVVMGPLVEDIGTGWHHLAATKSNDTVRIHVDGATSTVQFVASSLSFDNTTLWSLGGGPDDNLDFRLTDVAVDDVRITGFARYEGNFFPPSTYDDDAESVILLLLLDAGEGAVVSDEMSGINFAVENPAWVPGNAE